MVEDATTSSAREEIDFEGLGLEAPTIFLRGQQYRNFLRDLFDQSSSSAPGELFGRESEQVQVYRRKLGENSDEYLRADVMPLTSSNSPADDFRTPLLKGTRKGIIRAFELRLERDIKNSEIKQAIEFYKWLSSVPEVKEYMIHARMLDDGAAEPNIYHVSYDLNRLKSLLECGLVDQVEEFVETVVKRSTAGLERNVQRLKQQFSNHLNKTGPADRDTSNRPQTATNMAHLENQRKARVFGSRNQRALSTSTIAQSTSTIGPLVGLAPGAVPPALPAAGLRGDGPAPGSNSGAVPPATYNRSSELYTNSTSDTPVQPVLLVGEILNQLTTFLENGSNTDITAIQKVRSIKKFRNFLEKKTQNATKFEESVITSTMTQLQSIEDDLKNEESAKKEIQRYGTILWLAFNDYRIENKSRQFLISAVRNYYEARSNLQRSPENVRKLYKNEIKDNDIFYPPVVVSQIPLPSPDPVNGTNLTENSTLLQFGIKSSQPDVSTSKADHASVAERSGSLEPKSGGSEPIELKSEEDETASSQTSENSKSKSESEVDKQNPDKSLSTRALDNMAKQIYGNPTSSPQQDQSASEDSSNGSIFATVLGYFLKLLSSRESQNPSEGGDDLETNNGILGIIDTLLKTTDLTAVAVQGLLFFGQAIGVRKFFDILNFLMKWKTNTLFYYTSNFNLLGIGRTSSGEKRRLEHPNLNALYEVDFEKLSLANAACLSVAIHFLTHNGTATLLSNVDNQPASELNREKKLDLQEIVDNSKNQISLSFESLLSSFSGTEFVKDVATYSPRPDLSFLDYMGVFATTVLDHPTNRPAVRFRLFCSVCFRSDLAKLKEIEFPSATADYVNDCLEEILTLWRNGMKSPEGADMPFFSIIKEIVMGNQRTVPSDSRTLWDQLYKEDHKFRDHDNSMFSRYCIDRGLCGARSPMQTNQSDGRLPYNIGERYPEEAAKTLVEEPKDSDAALAPKKSSAASLALTNPAMDAKRERFAKHVLSISDFVDLRDAAVSVPTETNTNWRLDRLRKNTTPYIEPQRAVQWLPKNDAASRACVYEHFMGSVGHFEDGLGHELETEICCVAKLISLPYLCGAKTVSNDEFALRTRPCKVEDDVVKYPVLPGFEEYDDRDAEDRDAVLSTSAMYEPMKSNSSKRLTAPHGSGSIPSSKSRCVSWTGVEPTRAGDVRTPILVEIGGFTIDFREFRNLYNPPDSFEASEEEVFRVAGGSHRLRVYEDMSELKRILEAAIAACGKHIRHSEASNVIRGMQKADSDRERESVRIARERKQLIWNDALRESCICQDKLYAFVRQFSGTIGEPIESICNVDESKLIQHQTDTRKKRERQQQRVSELHGKLIELFVSVLLKESGLSIGLSAKDDVLRILPSLANKQAMDLLKNPSRENGLFTNSRNLDALLSRGERELSLEDLMKFIKSASESTDDAVDMDVDGDDFAEPESFESLSAARNSLMLRYSTEAKAAMRKAYDLLQTECRCSQVYDCRYRPSAYELIEGDNSELSNAFAQLCAHVLVKHRMTSTSISAYITRASVALNTQQVFMSLQKCTRVISEV
jgi:hypothetical protein